MTASDIDAFIRGLPKAELHVHVEGTFEPELMMAIAERNGRALPFETVEEAYAAYDFGNLQDFLDIYYRSMAVLLRPEDFHDLAAAYLARAAQDGVVHAEVMFDPQAHTGRGVALEAVIEGLAAALEAAPRLHGMSTRLILCFLRDKPADDAMATLEAARPHLDRITAVGLDSAERDHPPGGFAEVFARAAELGLRRTAHAGEEGPAAYVAEALDRLGAERIDHGNAAVDDDALMARLAADGTVLTMCPLSNLRLRVVERLEDHPLKAMAERGLAVTINSDDPAYFGGYVAGNYRAMHDVQGLDRAALAAIARNSLAGTFVAESDRARLLRVHDDWMAAQA